MENPVANNVDPDQMLHYVVSDLCLHYLPVIISQLKTGNYEVVQNYFLKSINAPEKTDLQCSPKWNFTWDNLKRGSVRNIYIYNCYVNLISLILVWRFLITHIAVDHK